MPADDNTGALTGRITEGPDELLRAEVLAPQLRFEIANLLPWYVQLEKVLLLEYHRMELLTAGQVGRIADLLDRITPESVRDTATETMSDIAFAVERFVTDRLDEVPPAWHVDRSRNDLQASAQLLYGRGRIVQTAELLVGLGRAALRRAGDTVDVVMPGYTHLQPAQVISPAFHLTALAEQVRHTLDRLEAVYRDASASPMGAGAMSGQELPWDRVRMAELLGCRSVRTHALVAVATRDWALTACAELALLGVTLSRFVTDLMTWGGGGYGFIDLPDAWSGISSAMPQKKNFPVLERIRARTAHLGSAFLDISLAQRNTPFSNSVEVSKEASAQVPAAFDAAASTLRLCTEVLGQLTFRADRMRAVCDAEFLGGFTLANLLTLRAGVPWRTAQVVAGRYVVAMTEQGRRPADTDAGELHRLLAEHGRAAAHCAELLAEAMDPVAGFLAKRSSGGTSPDSVRDMIAEQTDEFDRLAGSWADRRARIDAGSGRIDRLLAALARTNGVPC
jgi:argininosuccinate lyase